MGPQDVYPVVCPDGQSGPQWHGTRISVVLERGPTALSRVFALLCTVDLVPTTTSSAQEGNESIRLDLEFESVAQNRVDLLLRKLAQLVECLGVTHSHGGQHRLSGQGGATYGQGEAVL